MAKSNRDRISEVMDALKEGLGPFVLREYKMFYKGSRYLQEIELTLTTNAYASASLPDEQSALTKVDAQGWLNLMWRQWNDVFKTKLGQSERNFVSELITARNDWAHQKPFSNDDAYRIADTATRLLEAISATKQAQTVRDIAQELLRLRFEAEQKQAQKKTGSLEEAPTTTTRGLRPWRLVVKPHPDVASGRYILGDFVANIADVMQNKAAVEYADPKEFFRRTYLTEGLLDLLVTGVLRLSGQGGDPVVQLQTSFGGGKTHSMLALYHLFGGQIGFSEIPGGENIIKRVGNIDDRITANCAVIVGTAFSPTEPRRYKDATTNSIWGDIAYQLGGIEAYRMVEKADLASVSPGSDEIVKLLDKFGPALIIIDELVAFARNLPLTASTPIPAGTFDSLMTFFQSLTEAVRRSSDAMLLVSIPESENEIGGEQGKAALEHLSKTIGRIESVWKPVTATESFEIVRRRLFSSEIDYAARDGVLAAFRQMYADNTSEFPSGVAEGDYLRRMKEAYPIHPELFARLYEDWSTLDRFQRTRGVLRLMATVIHQLWQDNDQSLLIMPASIPLWAAKVRNEMLRYLPENWSAIVDADIDGEESKPYHMDKSVPTLGQYTASRRVARAVFIGSAPSVAGQSVRGVEEVRIRLATVQPGEQLAAFNDALRRMSNQLTYLYTDGSRYWYDTRPTVNRMAQDRAQNIHPDLVYQEAVARLRKEKWRREDFAAVHVAPQNSSDVVDDWRARVVVFAPDISYKKGNGNTNALQAIKEVLENRGNAPRLYRNMLVFVVADANDAEAWERALRDYLAWKSIHDDEEQLNLDAQQRKQVASNLKRTEETVVVRMQETYSWLLVPHQSNPADAASLTIEPFRISGQDSFYDRAMRKLRQSELLITRWSAFNLSLVMDEFNLWRNEPHVGVKLLWDYFARYCYLPRLNNEDVLLEAIQDGVHRADAPFGYAEAIDNAGLYKGLKFREPINRPYLSDSAVIVHPERAQIKITPPPIDHDPDPTPPPPPPPPPTPKFTRYHGTVALDPHKAISDMKTLVDEIVQRLTSLTGTEVEITLEISANRPDGFDDATIRTISENSRTLKFKHQGFEKD